MFVEFFVKGMLIIIWVFLLINVIFLEFWILLIDLEIM